MGRPATGGSGSTTWSATQSDSKPAPSAARANRAAASGYPHVWRLTECNPNFIARSPFVSTTQRQSATPEPGQEPGRRFVHLSELVAAGEAESEMTGAGVDPALEPLDASL